MTGPTLLIAAESRAWRRRLGPTAWAALEHLALAALPDEMGWAAPVGVRDVAAGLGVTKDTAARAVAALTATGLVTRTRVETDTQRRSGYRLHLPAGIEPRPRPDDADTRLPPREPERRPNHHDKRPTNPDSPPDAVVAMGGRERDPSKPSVNALRRPIFEQPVLFDPATRDEALTGAALTGVRP